MRSRRRDTTSRGSLRGRRKGKGGAADRRRTSRRGSWSGAVEHTPPAAPGRTPAPTTSRLRAAMGEQACGTSSKKSTAKRAAIGKRARRELYIPLQRHLFGDKPVMLACPEGKAGR